MTDVFIAYEFPDPWASRMILVDASLERLCRRLQKKWVPVTPFGPVIYRCSANEDPQQHGRPVAAWCGKDVVTAVDSFGETSGLMVPVSHFVLEFLDADAQRVRSGDRVQEDEQREVEPGGAEGSEGGGQG